LGGLLIPENDLAQFSAKTGACRLAKRKRHGSFFGQEKQEERIKPCHTNNYCHWFPQMQSASVKKSVF
jgi:hypothetical protein